jgi:hypothetical protein
MPPTLPTTRWSLTAPESEVLLNGPLASTTPLKLAVQELVTRGGLRLTTVDEKGLLGRSKRVSVLVPGDRAMPSESALAPIVAVYRALKPRSFGDGTQGVRVSDLAQALGKHFKTRTAYTHQAVLPGLAERGLFERKSGRVLFVIPTSKWVRTAAGEAARAELQQWVAVSREQFAAWVDHDPSQAAAYVGLAGAAVLLAGPLLPELSRLGAAIGNLDAFDSDLSFDSFDAFDSFDGFDSFDSGFDSGAPDTDSGSSSFGD